MVWGLYPDDPLPGEDNYYFFRKGIYKVGRNGCDVKLNKDERVSRIHAEILVDEMSSLDHLLKQPSNALSKVRVRDCSKYGTFINKNLDSMEKVQEFPNKEIILKDGDLVSFGTGNATYRFSYVCLTFSICSPENSRTDQLITMVSSIGVAITRRWSLDCSHVLVDDSFPLSEDLIDAIVARKPLVHYSWVELMAGLTICTYIPSFNSHAPNLMLEGVSVKVVDPQSRDCSLKGCIFLLEAENKYKYEGRLQSLLEVAGANVSSGEMALEKNGEAGMVRVVPAGSSSFSKNSSLPWVSETDLVSAVLSGYLDPSLITSPPDPYTRMIQVRTNKFGSGVRVGLKGLPDLKDLPESDPTDYCSMPVERFGESYLMAFGHKVNRGEYRQYAGRPERMGLGYIPPKEPKDEIEQPGPSHDEDEDISNNVASKVHLNSLLDTVCSGNISKQKSAVKEVRLLIERIPSLQYVLGSCNDAVTKLLNPLYGNVKSHPDLQEDLIIIVLKISDSCKQLAAQNPVLIPLLVESLKFGTLKTRSNSAAALLTLSTLDSNKDLIVKGGALKPLVDLIDEGEVIAMNNAALAICSLSSVKKNQDKAVSEGTVNVIMKKLKHRILVDESLAILALLSSHHKALKEMGELGGVSCLLSIIKEDTSDLNKEKCVVILYSVCCNDQAKRKEEIWIDESTNGTIANLARSGTPRAKRMANGILEQLAKYVCPVHNRA